MPFDTAIRPHFSKLGILLLMSGSAVLSARGPGDPGSDKVEPAKQDAGVWAQMRNVKFRFADDVAVQIRSLIGALVPVGEHAFPSMDDKNSFKIHIDAAEIVIYPSDLSNVLN